MDKTMTDDEFNPHPVPFGKKGYIERFVSNGELIRMDWFEYRIHYSSTVHELEAEVREFGGDPVNHGYISDFAKDGVWIRVGYIQGVKDIGALEPNQFCALDFPEVGEYK